MGSLFIKTEIYPERVAKANQPNWETIEIENFFYLPNVVLEPFAETIRFGDFLRSGGESVRYYHLLERTRGITLSISPSGNSRILSGFYQTRQLSLKGDSIPLQSLLKNADCRANPLHLASYSYLYLETQNRGRLIARMNCFEHYGSSVIFCASLRIPNCLLTENRSKYDDTFDGFLNIHAAANAPLATRITMPTTDLSLIVEANLEDYEFKSRLQFRRDHEEMLDPIMVALIE